MGRRRVLFSRQYRAALLDFLLGSGESGRERAYELGRRSLDAGLGVLQTLRAHQAAVNSILESTTSLEEGLRRVKAAEEFLMETLAPYDMACRGYVATLQRRRARLRGLLRD